MERVWIVSEEIYSQRESLPMNRHAEIVAVRDLNQLRRQLAEDERAVVLAPLSVLKKAKEEIPKALAFHLLPANCTHENLLFTVRLVLQEARTQHDLEAAENIAWKGVSSGQFDDPSIELIGSAILELSAARDRESVERSVLKACSREFQVDEMHIVAYPETASSRELGKYQLAVPIHFQGALRAHMYVKFRGQPDQAELDKVGDVLLNLSDAIALAVERNQMISKAEETKAVWEASFDAVEDPVAILDEHFLILRGNRAYSRFTKIPLDRLQGREPMIVSIADLLKLPQDLSSEWDMCHEARNFRAYFDPIAHPLGSGRFVLRFHDVTEERSLTEKILAKEQIAELGILVGSVAHEINNPIGGILAIGQILMKDLSKGSSLYQDVENIVHSAERCRKIIQTMLSLVRKADEEKSLVDVVDCVQSASDLLGSESKRLKVKMNIENKNNFPISPVFGNRNRLLQVLFHLLQQSLAALAERRLKEEFDAYLTVQLIPGYENLEIRIEDNGDPIKHEYEIQSSVAFTVAKMILEEHEAAYFFTRLEGRCQQRIIFSARQDISS